MFIDEDTAVRFPRLFLQGQRDQIAETAFGHGVLIRKQTVVAGQGQLSGAVAGVAYQRGPALASLAGRDRLGKKDPGMSAVAKAGNFQRRRNAEFPAGLHEGLGILPPVGLIEVSRQEIAAVFAQ